MTSPRLRCGVALAGLLTLILVSCVPDPTAPAPTAPGPTAPSHRTSSQPKPTQTPTSQPKPTHTPTSQATPTRKPSQTPGHPAEPIEDIFSAASFGAVRRQIRGTPGLVVVRTSAGSLDEKVARGSWTTGPAWSTSKVPLVMAALTQHDTAAERALARRAITASDNAAAQRLWRHLGAPMQAAHRMEQKLREAGDTATTVQYRVVRPGFSAFGQTRWALDDQAMFAARLTCSADAAVALGYMRRVVSSQQWGLGRIEGTALKGGWGPERNGRGYLVRQLGVLQTTDGSTWGVALAVSEPRGFSAGTRDLNVLADWLSRRLRAHRLTVQKKPAAC